MEPNTETEAVDSPTQTQAPPPNQIEEIKKTSRLTIFAISLALAILIPAGVFLYSKNQTPKKIAVVATSTPSPTPTPDPTANWKTYTSHEFSYSLNFPNDFEANDKNNGNNNTMIEKIITQPGGPSQSFFYISTIPIDGKYDGIIYNYEKNEADRLLALNIGENISLRKNITEGFNYSRLPDITIDGLTAKAFLNKHPWEFGPSIKEYRYYLTKGKYLYLIGGYVGESSGDDISESLFTQMLSTIKFTDQTSIDTSTWKTYQGNDKAFTTNDWNNYEPSNTIVPFSIKFPPTWTKDYTVFHDGPENKIAEFSPGAVVLSDSRKCFDKPFGTSGGKLEEETPISIGSHEGVKRIVKTDYEGGPSGNGTWYASFYCVQSGNKAFIMAFYEKTLGTGIRNTFDTIMSTFKFTQ